MDLGVALCVRAHVVVRPPGVVERDQGLVHPAPAFARLEGTRRVVPRPFVRSGGVGEVHDERAVVVTAGTRSCRSGTCARPAERPTIQAAAGDHETGDDRLRPSDRPTIEEPLPTPSRSRSSGSRTRWARPWMGGSSSGLARTIGRPRRRRSSSDATGSGVQELTSPLRPSCWPRRPPRATTGALQKAGVAFQPVPGSPQARGNRRAKAQTDSRHPVRDFSAEDYFRGKGRGKRSGCSPSPSPGTVNPDADPIDGGPSSRMS